MKKILVAVSVICIGVAIFLVATVMRNGSSREDFSNTVPDRTVGMEELTKNNGLNGNRCWVAVDGIVYDIHGFAQWEMGRHIPSGGKATCGRDLSEVILQSPHGKKVLQELDVVGKLASI